MEREERETRERRDGKRDAASGREKDSGGCCGGGIAILAVRRGEGIQVS